MKVLHLFDTPSVQCPSLAFTKQSSQDYSSVDFPLRREANVMVIENLCAQPPYSAWLALLILDVTSLSRNPSFKMMLSRRGS